jgi:hypothetical protein
VWLWVADNPASNRSELWLTSAVAVIAHTALKGSKIRSPRDATAPYVAPRQNKQLLEADKLLLPAADVCSNCHAKHHQTGYPQTYGVGKCGQSIRADFDTHA